MTVTSSEKIAEILEGDLSGRHAYYIDMKVKAHREIQRGLALFARSLGRDLILHPDQAYPQLEEALKLVAYGIQKFAISFRLTLGLIADTVRLTHEPTYDERNIFLRRIYDFLRRRVYPGFDALCKKVEVIRRSLPIQRVVEMVKGRDLSFKEIHAVVDQMEDIEKDEKKLASLVRMFFKSNRRIVKSIPHVIKQIEKGKVPSLEMFAAKHPISTIGFICLIMGVLGYVGVFITLAYGVLGIIYGASALTIFGIGAKMTGLKLFGSFFFSSGYSTLYFLITKGARKYARV